jgi:pimeloyl-ACP methyl ester carboxylesterase
VSALVWGEGPPELVLIHGSAQNAHTFDTVALALERPLVALDLPHHGHSDASFFGPRALKEHARDVAVAIKELCPDPLVFVAMSYGGLVGITLLHGHPELATRLILIDITPGVSARSARHILDFIEGPESFANFDEILERTTAFNPGRSEASLRRGIMHNAIERPDGTWVWRHQRHGAPTRTPEGVDDLWQWLEDLAAPVTLVRALGPSSVVTDEDAEEFRRRRPHDEIVEVPGAGHSIQGSHPLELAEIIAARL